MFLQFRRDTEPASRVHVRCDDRYTSQAARFIVGVPPTYTGLSGFDTAGINYARDLNATTFTGSALQLLTKVEIVDIIAEALSHAAENPF